MSNVDKEPDAITADPVDANPSTDLQELLEAFEEYNNNKL